MSRPQQGDAADPAAIDSLSVQTRARGQHGESEDVEAGAVLRAFAPHELVSPEELNLPQPDGTFVPIKRGPVTSTLIAVCEAAVGPRSGTQDIAGRLSRVETCFSNTLEALLANPDIEIRPMSRPRQTAAVAPHHGGLKGLDLDQHPDMFATEKVQSVDTLHEVLECMAMPDGSANTVA